MIYWYQRMMVPMAMDLVVCMAVVVHQMYLIEVQLPAVVMEIYAMVAYQDRICWVISTWLNSAYKRNWKVPKTRPKSLLFMLCTRRMPSPWPFSHCVTRFIGQALGTSGVNVEICLFRLMLLSKENTPITHGNSILGEWRKVLLPWHWAMPDIIARHIMMLKMHDSENTAISIDHHPHTASRR